MATRLFNLAAGGSLILVGALVLLSFSPGSDPRTRHVNLCGWCYVGVNGTGPDANFYIFNDRNAGPLYFGLYPIISGEPKLYEIKGTGFGYWRLRWRDGTSLWTIRLRVVYPLIAALVLPALWFIARRRRGARGFPVGSQPVAG